MNMSMSALLSAMEDGAWLFSRAGSLRFRMVSDGAIRCSGNRRGQLAEIGDVERPIDDGETLGVIFELVGEAGWRIDAF